MRIWWIATLVLLLSNALFAQAEGEVESIGLDAYYRADCWVPMTVQLRPTGNSAAELQIRVIQEDLDRDRVVAARDITLTPDISGTADRQRFWMYFRPQASNTGLSDAAVGGTIKDLTNQLKVVLTTRGGTTIATLPITQQNLKRAEVGDSARVDDVEPSRLVLCVSEGGGLPQGREYELVDGLSARPRFLSIRPRDLPEDSRGFEMIDAILWMGATAPDPRRSLEEPRYRAIEQYVQQGGHLVICQGAEAAKLRGFEQILPVRISEFRESTDLQPLPTMGNLDWTKPPEGASQPRRVAVSSALPGSLVVRTKTFDESDHPFVARRSLGTGAVTWVAQDLGEISTVRALRGGWVRIWDEIFGWRNSPVPMKANPDADATAFSDPAGVSNIGGSFESGGRLNLTASGYVLVAVLFFAIYWVAAGPGLYAYLSVRKLASLNWFLFGVIAVAAALLAAIVVRIIQSGSPIMEHVTIIRSAPGEHSIVQSRIGLYVPSDGMKELQITNTTPQTTNWITPFPEHPALGKSGQSEFLAMKQYTMPIVDSTSEDPIAVSMPWRSTMKELQVRWNGDLEGRVDGQVNLTGQMAPELAGTLVNGTPWDLREIYLAYRLPSIAGDGTNAGGDRIIYIPKWPKGQSINIGQLLTSDKAYRIGRNALQRESMPGYDVVVYGGIERMHRSFGSDTESPPPGEGWAGFWYSRDFLGSNFGLINADDSGRDYQVSLPVSSLFDRIPPMRNSRKDSGFSPTRRQIGRIGARFLNISPSLAAGNLVVLAQTKAPLPIPFTVDGDKPEGDGVIFCQFILPLGQSARPAVEKQ